MSKFQIIRRPASSSMYNANQINPYKQSVLGEKRPKNRSSSRKKSPGTYKKFKEDKDTLVSEPHVTVTKND